MKIFDSHVHLFTPRIIDNVVPRTDLVGALNLTVEKIENRLSTSALIKEMQAAGVYGALMLPTANVAKLRTVNRDSVQTAIGVPGLYTAGTLHPDYADIEDELSLLNEADVRVIKLSSFSQKFSLSDPKTHSMFDRIQSFNAGTRKPFAVILDTLTLAEQYFGTNPEHTTTPLLLMDLVRRFPGVRFIGAHMGGLGAPFDHLERHLQPMSNLLLDTSNAAHTLTKDQFIQMLQHHGSGQILFGTDWPWFLHESEIKLLDDRMNIAGFTVDEKRSVFSGNIEKILGIASPTESIGFFPEEEI